MELALKISDDLFQLLGVRPYLVAADFTRKQIDANRPGGLQAYESPAAGAIYDFYHGKLQEFVNEVKQKYGDRAILIDIHGQGSDAKTVYRGTRDRSTVKRLLARDGEAGLTGPNSILGLLERKGYTLYPGNSDRHRDEKGIYSGGYIVGAYGSQNANGIDAIQLENGWDLRRSQRDRFAQNLAESLTGFYLHYLVQ